MPGSLFVADSFDKMPREWDGKTLAPDLSEDS